MGCEYLSPGNGELNFNLIEPTGMDRGVYEEHVGPLFVISADEKSSIQAFGSAPETQSNSGEGDPQTSLWMFGCLTVYMCKSQTKCMPGLAPVIAEQIVYALRQIEGGKKVMGVCRGKGASSQAI